MVILGVQWKVKDSNVKMTFMSNYGVFFFSHSMKIIILQYCKIKVISLLKKMMKILSH